MVKTAAAASSNGGGAAAAAARQGGKRAYKGVRMRSWGSWVSEVRAPGQKTRIWLGSHSTADAAARAYDAALLCLRGSAAAADLNFPLPRLPFDLPPAAMSPKAIQRVAAAAAAAASCTPPPFAPSARNDSNGSSACSDHHSGDATPAWSTTSPSSDVVSSPESTVSSEAELVAAHYDGGDGEVDYSSLADIDAFFQSPKCMDYALMDPCSAFFAPAAMAVDDDDAGCCWEEGGDIALWSFSTLEDCC